MAKLCSVNIHYDRKLDACAPARAASVCPKLAAATVFWPLACHNAYRGSSL
jgi:hypothetical protein